MCDVCNVCELRGRKRFLKIQSLESLSLNGAGIMPQLKVLINEHDYSGKIKYALHYHCGEIHVSQQKHHN